LKTPWQQLPWTPE